MGAIAANLEHLGPTPTATAGANLQPGQGDPQLPIVGQGRLCLPMLYSDTMSSWGRERTGGKAGPSREAGMPPSIPVPSGGLLADRYKAGCRTPHLQLPVTCMGTSVPQGTEEHIPGKEQQHRPRGGPCLVCTPQQGCCRDQGAHCPRCLHCNLCHHLWSRASWSCTGKQKHREGDKAESGGGTPQVTSRTGEGGV